MDDSGHSISTIGPTVRNSDATVRTGDFHFNSVPPQRRARQAAPGPHDHYRVDRGPRATSGSAARRRAAAMTLGLVFRLVAAKWSALTAATDAPAAAEAAAGDEQRTSGG